MSKKQAIFKSQSQATDKPTAKSAFIEPKQAKPADWQSVAGKNGVRND